MKRYQLEGYVGDEITPTIVSDMLLDANNEDIVIDLYTSGGQIYDGIEVYNRIAKYPGKKTAVLGGLVASIGTYISTAFDVVQAQSSTVFMLHNAASIAIGDADDLEKEAKELKRLNQHIAERLASRIGKTVDEITTMMDEETYLYGQEIVDEGFADEILENDKTPIDKKEAERIVASAEKQYKDRIAHKEKKAYNKKQNNIVDSDIRKITNEEIKVMDKTELLKRLNVLRQNGDITLLEIATSLELESQLATDESRQAVELVQRLNKAGVKDIEAEIKKLQERANEADQAKRENALLEAFGPKKNQDGTVNVVREYAEKIYNDQTSIEDIGNDEIMKRLQAQQADYTSEANRVGVVEGQQSKKNPDGPKTVEY